MQIENKLKDMGIELPTPPKPAASYMPCVPTGNLIFVSGQGPVKENKPVFVGRLGAELDVSQGKEAAKLAIINSLAQLKAHLGDLDRISRIVKVLGFVACTDTFEEQPYVVNGASDFLEQVFGEKGKHARSAVGTNSLPFNIPIEIEIIVEIE